MAVVSCVGGERQPARARRPSQAPLSSCRTRCCATTSREAAPDRLGGLRARTLASRCAGRGRPRAALDARARALVRGGGRAVAEGVNVLMISDRGVGARRRRRSRPCSPSAAVHHHLIREGSALRAGLVVESGEPREVPHLRLLIGYGASAVNPYLAFERSASSWPRACRASSDADDGREQRRQGAREGAPEDDVEDGDLDAPELPRRADLRGDRPRPGVVDRVLRRHASRIGGIGLDELGDERWSHACASRPVAAICCRIGRVRRGAARRAPRVDRRDHALQHAVATAAGDLRGVLRSLATRSGRRRRCARCWISRAARAPSGSAGGGRAGLSDRQALRHRRDVGRLDQREAHETLAIAMNRRRQDRTRRGRRGRRALQPDPTGTRALGHQASRLRPLRRHPPLSRQRRRAADQDRARRQAGRGRPAARSQGRPRDRLVRFTTPGVT